MKGLLGEGTDELTPQSYSEGCKSNFKKNYFVLDNLSSIPLLANLGPLIADMNLEFANFIVYGK